MAEQAERLVTLWILGQPYRVPAGGSLLQALQHLRIRAVTAAGFCWSGECATCEVEVDRGMGAEGVFACQTPLEDGLRILDLSIVLRHCLRDLPGVQVRSSND